MSRKPPADEARDKERIAKVMARAGLCSRRDAETWITAGRVAVNGKRLTSPAFTVSPRDRIEVDGKPLPGRERTRLFLYHKPKGLVTTNRDERGRPTIFGALPKHLPRLVTIGRLDLNSEGLLLLTNDGGLARALELPETGWLRRYRVRANGRATQAALDRLSRGIKVEGIEYGPIQATLDREQGANVWLTLGLREGKNREVRNVLRELGLSVNRLIRVSYGPFQLGELAPAAVEEVKMRVLREQIGEKLERRAGVDFSAPLREQEGEPSQKLPRPSPTPSPGKASRSPSSSPHPRERWKGKRNAALGKARRK
jgi:23S rRNA pseudouridine2605 synthase